MDRVYLFRTNGYRSDAVSLGSSTIDKIPPRSRSVLSSDNNGDDTAAASFKIWFLWPSTREICHSTQSNNNQVNFVRKKMYSKGISSLPSIATLAAAAVVLRCFLFRKTENRADSPLSHTHPSSSSPDPTPKTGVYQVFLSFCGRDTRQGFTDFLYTYLVGASIITFRDDNELRVGNEIGPELLKSIQESKISTS